MENVIVEPATGDVGVSTLIKAAMPELHAGSVLRSVHNVLKKPDAVGLDLTTKTVNGRMTRMASLEMCNYILDNMPGHRWTVWRTSQGDSFKESLAQRVSQARESCSEEVPGEVQNEPQGEEEVQEELQETKESTMKKALRTLDIDGSVRIDEASGKASIIDVIRLLCPGMSSHGASQMLIRLLEKEAATEPEVWSHNETSPDSIASRIQYVQINGAGRSTPVSDAKTIVEIIWLLPARAARSFRRQSAEVICRVLGGDVSLCGEIEERCARLESTPSGRSYQEFMMGGADDQQPEAKRTRIGPKIMELASEEEYAQYVKLGLKTEMVKTEVSLVMSLKEAFEEITPLQERHKIELCDRISDIQKRAFRAVDTSREALPAIANSPMNVDAVVMAAPLTTQDPGHDTPTPQCSPEVRGEEVSIAMIATEMGVSVRGRGGQIGKKLKALYAQRYGSIAANELPKRHTIFQGRPYFENSYYARDRDLVQQAITTVVT